jgi:hypothetical protein
LGEAQRAHGEAHDREAEQQQAARAEAVYQDAGRDLRHAGRDVQDGDQEAELGIACPQLLAQQREQGRQSEQVEVAHGVAGADQRENLRVAPQHFGAASVEQPRSGA